MCGVILGTGTSWFLLYFLQIFLKRLCHMVACDGLPNLVINRKSFIPSISIPLDGFLFSIIRLKHSATSSDIGMFLTPFSLLGFSIIVRLCPSIVRIRTWWSTFMHPPEKSILLSVNPTNSDIRNPVLKRIYLIFSLNATQSRFPCGSLSVFSSFQL